MAQGTHKGTGLYILIALILGVITFIEYVIVEFPPTWMSSGWILFWVIVMSVAKFWMVIWFFMHLRDDPKIYTGFFTSGMVIGIGTFVVLMAMFLLPRAVAPVVAQEAPVEQVAEVPAEPDPLGAERRELIDSDGVSRPLASRAGTPRPRDGSLVVTPPAVAEPDVTVVIDPPEPVAEAAPEPEVAPEPEAAVAEPDPEEPLAVAEPEVVDAPEVVDDPEVVDAPEAVDAPAPDPTFDTELGASTYANCVGCHQPTGAGIPGAFPPLVGHTADLFNADGGRAYLIDMMLYGLQGEIVVDGTTYNGLMPAFPQLSDDAIAAVLNHTLTEWGNDTLIDDFDAIRPEEITAERDKGLSASDVYRLRGELGLE